MFNKIKNDPKFRELIIKIITVVTILAVALLAFDVMGNSKDGRKQIVSDDEGKIETSLCNILTDIKGAGDVDVMIQYNDEGCVSGVIVTAQGAGDVVVQNKLVNAVKALFNIPASSVSVYEKENGGAQK